MLGVIVPVVVRVLCAPLLLIGQDAPQILGAILFVVLAAPERMCATVSTVCATLRAIPAALAAIGRAAKVARWKIAGSLSRSLKHFHVGGFKIHGTFKKILHTLEQGNAGLPALIAEKRKIPLKFSGGGRRL